MSCAPQRLTLDRQFTCIRELGLGFRLLLVVRREDRSGDLQGGR